MIWLAIGILGVEILGIVGLVFVLNADGYAAAQIAVSIALVVVPVLFSIALYSEFKGKR